MIDKVSIHNFKCLRDVQADLERFTVFVGPNASGKSSILQALDGLCRMFRGVQLGNLFSGDVVSQGTTDGFELAAQTEDKAFRYRTKPLPVTTEPSVPSLAWKGAFHGVASSLLAEDWTPWRVAKSGPPPLPRSVLLRLETSKLVSPAPNSPDPTFMAPNGTGLHAALANMALNDPDSWHALQSNLCQMIPSIRRLRHTRSTGQGHHLALLFDTVGADSVPADLVSEGTLFVLGLLTALHTSDGPKLVMLDDLDRGLHPKAQRELIALLRRMLATNPELQIIATTHSPYMLDCMEVDEVRMTFLNDDGATVCAALTSHPKFPKWKDEMTPGEMWSLFGEKWIAEEVPA